MPFDTERLESEKFKELSPEAKSLVIDRLLSEDEGFGGLSTEAQDIVRSRLQQRFNPDQPTLAAEEPTPTIEEPAPEAEEGPRLFPRNIGDVREGWSSPRSRTYRSL